MGNTGTQDVNVGGLPGDLLAEDVSYDNSDSGLTSEELQGAVDELAVRPAGGSSIPSIDDPSLWPGSVYDQEFDGDDVATLPSGFVWVNQGASAYRERFGGAQIFLDQGGNQYDWRGISCPLVLTNGQSIVAKITPNIINSSSDHRYGCCLALRDSVSGVFAALELYWTDSAMGNIGIYGDIWNSPVTYGSSLFSVNYVHDPKYFAITKNSSTSYDMYVSSDGVAWVKVTASSLDLSSISWDHVAILGMCDNNTNSQNALGVHWLRVADFPLV